MSADTPEEIELMPLDALLSTIRDGDEHGWDTEFAYLRQQRGPYLDLLVTSIQETGMQTPVLVGSDGRLWDGHHRLCAAQMLGLYEVPVTRVPPSEHVAASEATATVPSDG